LTNAFFYVIIRYQKKEREKTKMNNKLVDLLFNADEEDVLVQLNYEGKTKNELKQEGKQTLQDWGFTDIKFIGFFTLEQGERMGLDTY
jgi:hypothetical protein